MPVFCLKTDICIYTSEKTQYSSSTFDKSIHSQECYCYTGKETQNNSSGLSPNPWPLLCYSTIQHYYYLFLLLVFFSSLLRFCWGMLSLTTAALFILKAIFQPLKDIAQFHHVSFSDCTYTSSTPWYQRQPTLLLLTFHSRFNVSN